MSRRIYGKITVSGTLEAVSPVSCGGTGAGEHVDLELAEDGTGRAYIPGTSIAGALRGWLCGHGIPDEVFGGSDTGASLLAVSDAPALNPSRERRHGIAIDRGTGTARDEAFYTRAILPKGTRFALDMELDLTGPDWSGAGVLAVIAGALAEGNIRFGSCRTRGMGVMLLKDAEINCYDFINDPEALDLYLECQPSANNSLDGFTKPPLNDGGTISISIPWRPVTPLMVKSGRDGIEADMLPLMSGTGEGISPVIPGSSLKGVFRAQAEKILCTIFSGDRGQEIISDMFGSQSSKGRLMFKDVYCTENVSAEGWLEEDADTLDAVTEKEYHTAIDRFTGGASESALYSARPVKASKVWDRITITLDTAEAGERTIKAELALLKLIIGDIAAGRVTLGFGTLRGLGRIELAGEAEGLPETSELIDAWRQFIANGGSLN